MSEVVVESVFVPCERAIEVSSSSEVGLVSRSFPVFLPSMRFWFEVRSMRWKTWRSTLCLMDW
jgi:hypothetical protein